MLSRSLTNNWSQRHSVEKRVNFTLLNSHSLNILDAAGKMLESRPEFAIVLLVKLAKLVKLVKLLKFAKLVKLVNLLYIV